MFLAVVVTANIPLTGVRRALDGVNGPVQAATGARQVWSVFAPDPNEVVGSVAVRFTYRDGTTSIWRIRRGGALLHAYRDYRWLKLAENAARSSAAATGLLLWAASTKAEDKPLARADLVRNVYDIAPPGLARSQHAAPDSGVILSLRSAG